jgi:hypothetical protein
MAEKKQPDEKPEKTESTVILMPVSDVADWDDDERLKAYPDVDWPMDGRSEEEVIAASKKLLDPKGE